MARVLCINPWIVDFAAYNLWIEPLGLLTVAGMVRQVGHQVDWLDCLDRHHPAAPAPPSPRDQYGCGRFLKTELPKPRALRHVPRRWSRYGLPVEVFEDDLAACARPDAVLVTSMMTYWYPGPFEVIRRVKARWPDVPVALGGVYATLSRGHALALSGADVVWSGAAGNRLLRWLARLAGEACPAPSASAGVLPAHDLRRPHGYVAIQTAQGCPFDCPYCAVHMLCPAGFVPRPTDEVLDELAWCVEGLGAEDVAFYDDALLHNATSHIYPILDGILQRGLRVRLHAPNGVHARYIDRALARKMREAGFVTIRLGLETVDPRGGWSSAGKVDEHSFGRAAQALRCAGFSAGELAAYVLIARPGQTPEDALAMAHVAQRHGVSVRTAQFSPVPRTIEFGAAVAAGHLTRDADPLLHNNSAYPCEHRDTWEALKREIHEGNRHLQ